MFATVLWLKSSLTILGENNNYWTRMSKIRGRDLSVAIRSFYLPMPKNQRQVNDLQDTHKLRCFAETEFNFF